MNHHLGFVETVKHMARAITFQGEFNDGAGWREHLTLPIRPQIWCYNSGAQALCLTKQLPLNSYGIKAGLCVWVGGLSGVDVGVGGWVGGWVGVWVCTIAATSEPAGLTHWHGCDSVCV